MSEALETEITKIRIALERIADHVDPAGKKDKPVSVYETQGVNFA